MVSRFRFRPAAALVLILAAALLLSGAGSAGSFIADLAVPLSAGAFPAGSMTKNTGVVPSAAGDLDGDGKTEEYFLADGGLTVREGGKVLWESPQDLHVDSFALGDADNDRSPNLVVSLWKKGSFGKIRPFWHTGEDVGCKNHLFVYILKGKACKPVWCSSDLDRPILSFAIRDANDDGKNELVVKEGQYGQTAGERYFADPSGSSRTTLWQWDEWGFRLLAPSFDSF